MKNIYYVLRKTWKHDRGVFLYLLLIGLCGVLASITAVYIPERILQAATNAISYSRALQQVTLLAIGLGITSFGNIYTENMLEAALINNRVLYINLVQNKWMRMDYAHAESTLGQEKYHKALHIIFNDESGAYGMLRTLSKIGTSVLGCAAYIRILCSLHIGVVCFIVVVTLIHFTVLRNDVAYEYKHRKDWQALDHQYDYVLHEFENEHYGKEIRIFSLRKVLDRLANEILCKRNSWRKKVEDHHYKAAMVESILMFFRNAVAYGYIVYAIINQQITIADFTLYLGSITALSAFLSSLADTIVDIKRTAGDIKDIRSFLEWKDEQRGQDTLDQNGPIQIEFRHVFFGYKHNDEMILKDLSFSIMSGEKIALVGANGSGKTTLIKLLCGFYLPDSGEILINGKNIKSYTKDSLQKTIATVFQESTVFPMTLAENVAMEEIKDIDEKNVKICLKQAGLEEYAEDNMMHHAMTKIFDQEGYIFSGGMQQKLMLARALYKRGKLLLLDEPTAALDPIAEREMYRTYSQLITDTTSIFVSHRLASTQFCDRILYLQDGHIVENGTHQELMDQNGEYRRLYEVQSQYYKEN